MYYLFNFVLNIKTLIVNIKFSTMKRIISIIFLILIVFHFSFSQQLSNHNALGKNNGIIFESGNWNEILKKAKKTNKIIMIDMYTSWCGPCKLMAREIFPDDTIGKFYNNNFINAHFDAEKGEGKDLAKKYKIIAYPSFIFCDSNGEVLHRAVGSCLKKDFIILGEIALDPNRRIGELIKRYEKGERGEIFLKQYLLGLTDAGIVDNDVFVQYMNILTEEKMITADNFRIFEIFANGYEHKAIQTVLKNKEKFYELISKEKVDKKIIYEILRDPLLQNEMHNDNKSTEEIDKAINRIQNLGTYDEMAYVLHLKAAKAKRMGNVNLYMEYIDKIMRNNNWNNWNELNTYAQYCYEDTEIIDKKHIEIALKWAKRSIEIENNSTNNDTYAWLWYKYGDLNQAKIYADKAIMLAKRESVGYKSTDKLLKKLNK